MGEPANVAHRFSFSSPANCSTPDSTICYIAHQRLKVKVNTRAHSNLPKSMPAVPTKPLEIYNVLTSLSPPMEALCLSWRDTDCESGGCRNHRKCILLYS